ncbi:Polyadenylate-binding protein 2 [Platanthera guangdongensis]|uniref:Polyadenylate-binding protein 2 n=1 Tax=Platanthera guangdongensis TaxID=2320717 RepID=A0ABR2N3W7_9ASPA
MAEEFMAKRRTENKDDPEYEQLSDASKSIIINAWVSHGQVLKNIDSVYPSEEWIKYLESNSLRERLFKENLRDMVASGMRRCSYNSIYLLFHPVSFGVLLLEIVSGRRSAGLHEFGSSCGLLAYNLSSSITEEDLAKFFGEYGRTTSIVVMRDLDGKSKCFGFVNFENPDDAATAVQELNGKKMEVKDWYIGRAQKKTEREQELKTRFEQSITGTADKYQWVNLYLKNLDDSIGDEKLNELFSHDSLFLKQLQGDSLLKYCNSTLTSPSVYNQLSPIWPTPGTQLFRGHMGKPFMKEIH